MREKISVLARLLIFPNTNYPGCKAFIIAGVDLNLECYVADTDTASIYKDFWNKELKIEERTGAMQAMLNTLELAYGHRFRCIVPWNDEELKEFRL
jgi:hypothetical protein